MTACGHPVGRESDSGKPIEETRCSDVHQRFRHSHPGGCCWGDERQCRLLTHSHSLASLDTSQQRCSCYRYISHRGLPLANHLIASGKAAHSSVSNSDKERLGSYSWESENSVYGLSDQAILRRVRDVH